MSSKFNIIFIILVLIFTLCIFLSNNTQPMALYLFSIEIAYETFGMIFALLSGSFLLFSIINILMVSSQLSKAQKKVKGLAKDNDDLKKKLEKLTKEHAFQAKKVCFLEETLHSDEIKLEEKKEPRKPKPKKPLFPWKLKFVKNESKKQS